MKEYDILKALYDLCIRELDNKEILIDKRIHAYIYDESEQVKSDLSEKITFSSGEISGIKMAIEIAKEIVYESGDNKEDNK